MIKEINKADILQLLEIEKGSTARIIIETLDLTEPPEVMYTEEHIRYLLQDLETNYYNRYEFDHM